MKFESLKIAKILSFGHIQEELNDFSYFNLFIGKNGTGKTNIFKILQGLPFQFRRLSIIELGRHFPSFNHKFLQNEGAYIFFPEIDFNTIINRETKGSEGIGLLEINYSEITSVSQSVPDMKCIKFIEDTEDSHYKYGFSNLKYFEGDVTLFSRSVTNIKLPETEADFHKDLSLFGNDWKDYLTLLHFGLHYIFGLHFLFQPTTFVQGKLVSGGEGETDIKNLPSGVLNCAKLLIRYFLAIHSYVILFDEPELHLEPRVIRKLFQFFVWLSVRGKQDKSPQEEIIFKLVEDYLKKANWDRNSFPEATGNNWKQKQLFIASHSPVLINEFLTLRSSASIYEFNNRIIEFNNRREYSNPDLQRGRGLFTTVRKIDSYAISIIENLGCKGSDLLQTNGIIWVEGPSDVIYLKKWLDMYAFENELEKFIQGKHYEFQMFGGTLLDSISLIQNGENESEEYKKILSMFSFSKNAFIVIDSDCVKNSDSKIYDQSKFYNAKQYIKSEIENYNKNNERKIGLWYKDGNTDIRTIEDYLDAKSMQMKKESWTKKVSALKITQLWEMNKKLSDFPNKLEQEIKNLYNIITEWNKD
jgi:energy-coupling factor transporter ATP-binding protein EcfA2